MDIGKYFSTPHDDKPLKIKLWTNAAATSAIGLTMGLAIATFRTVTRDVIYVDDLLSPKVVLSLAIGLMFVTSAFGRGKTHIARGYSYGRKLLLIDVVFVFAGVALLGLLARDNIENFKFIRWFWLWLFLVLVSLGGRNLYLGGQNVKGLKYGTIFTLVAGLVVGIFGLGFGLSGPIFPLALGIVSLILIVFQFWFEIFKPISTA